MKPSALALIAAGALALAGCGSPAPQHAQPAVGYVTGTAEPCSPMPSAEPSGHVEVVVLGSHKSSRFTPPTIWGAGGYHFRFAAHPGHYRIYEAQRYDGPYETVAGLTVDVRAGVTSEVTLVSMCR